MPWNTSANDDGIFSETNVISFPEHDPKTSDGFDLIFIDQPTEVDVQMLLNSNATALTSAEMTEESFVYQEMPVNTLDDVKDPVDQMLAQWTKDLDDGFLQFLDDDRDMNSKLVVAEKGV